MFFKKLFVVYLLFILSHAQLFDMINKQLSQKKKQTNLSDSSPRFVQKSVEPSSSSQKNDENQNIKQTDKQVKFFDGRLSVTRKQIFVEPDMEFALGDNIISGAEMTAMFKFMKTVQQKCGNNMEKCVNPEQDTIDSTKAQINEYIKQQSQKQLNVLGDAKQDSDILQEATKYLGQQQYPKFKQIDDQEKDLLFNSLDSVMDTMGL